MGVHDNPKIMTNMAGRRGNNSPLVFNDTRQLPGTSGRLPILEHDAVANRETFVGSATLIPEIVHLGMVRYTEARSELPPHIHRTCYEICYVSRGMFEGEIAGCRHDVQAGDFFVTWPGEVHGGTHSVMRPCELFFMQVCFPGAEQAASAPGLSLRAFEPLLAGLRYRCFPGGAHAESLCRRLIEECGHPDPFSVLLMRPLLGALIIEVARAHAHRARSPESPSVSPSVRKALDHLTNHLDTAPSVTEVARAAGLSRSSFHQRFKRETGITPCQYLLNQRIRHAQRLLRETDASVTDIALCLGFCSSQHFATAFHRQVGLTPAAFREATAKPAD